MGTKTSHEKDIEGSNKNIEVWEDLVGIKDLVKSLLICSTTTMGGYFLALNKPPMPLFFGLFGALLGFVISSFFITPKRIFQEIESEE